MDLQRFSNDSDSTIELDELEKLGGHGGGIAMGSKLHRRSLNNEDRSMSISETTEIFEIERACDAWWK